MSCEHGNWPQCDQCDALDAKWNQGYASASARIDKLLLLLRECDAALAMLGGVADPAKYLRLAIAKAISAGEQP